MDTLMPLLYVLIFPGFLFLLAFSFFAEYFDRKVVARLQNRQGPPWYQPVADTIKLLSKEDIITRDADRPMVNTVPLFGLAAVAASFLYVPMWTSDWSFSFQGDLIVVLYLLTIPAFVLVLLGWYSPNPFGSIGTGRVVTQLFGYEVPFALALLAPAIAAQSWRITDIVAYQEGQYWFALTAPIAFVVAVAGLVGKLERVPHAKTEIVEGPMTEYTGRKYALLKLMFSTETVVGAVLLAAIFLGGPHLPWVTKAVAGTAAAPVVGFFAVVLKALFIVFLLSVIKAGFTRLRIDQMVRWCLTWLTIPILIQILYIVIVASM